VRPCKAPISLLLLTVLLGCGRPGGSPTPAASSLTLKIFLSKPEFFEGEPIYGLFELRNVGSDTVRIPPFGVNAGWLAAELHRPDGSVAPGGRNMIVDYICRETCNDDPVAPGQARYEPFIVQELWGERGPLPYGILFRRIDAGAYTLDVSFGLDRVPESTLVVASPVVFRVRPRRPAEDTVFLQFARFVAVDVRAWTVADLDSALALIDRRLAADSADPFALDVLILSDTHTSVKRLPVDSTVWTRIFQRELAIAKAQAASSAGAYAAAHLLGGRWSRKGALCSTLAGTIAGDVACEREAESARMQKSSRPH